MNTQNIKGSASESSKTWVKGKKHKLLATSSQGVKVCVNAADLRMRWVTLESGDKKAALYDAGETSAKRYIIVSRGQIFYRTGTWSLASKKYLRRASEVLREEVRKFLDTFDAAIEAGLDLYQASDVARGFITLEKALNPDRNENQETASGNDAEHNELPF